MKKIFFITGVAMATAGFAQKVNNKLSFLKGQKLEAVVQTDKISTIELMGQSMDTKATSTVNEVWDVQHADKNGATLRHTIKRMQFEASNPMGQAQSFDSDKDTDRNGEIGKLLQRNLKTTYTITVDGSGKITSVQQDDTASKNKTGADMGDLVSSQLGMNMLTPKKGDASAFKILPDKEVGVGDTWTDSSSTGGQKRKTTYTVKSITDKEIILDFTEQLNINTTQQIMPGMDAKIVATDKSAGIITLDKASGLLKQKTATMEEEGSMEAQGQTIPMKGKTNITMTVKPE